MKPTTIRATISVYRDDDELDLDISATWTEEDRSVGQHSAWEIDAVTLDGAAWDGRLTEREERLAWLALDSRIEALAEAEDEARIDAYEARREAMANYAYD